MAGAAILGGTLAASYLADHIAGGIAPGVSVLVALAAATAIVATFRHHTRWGRRDVAVYLSIVTATLIYLLWLAWPSLLRLGGGLHAFLERRDLIDAAGHVGGKRGAPGNRIGRASRHQPTRNSRLREEGGVIRGAW